MMTESGNRVRKPFGQSQKPSSQELEWQSRNLGEHLRRELSSDRGVCSSWKFVEFETMSRGRRAAKGRNGGEGTSSTSC